MKIKIVSDGTAWGTKVVDADTGETLEKVISVSWEHDLHRSPEVTITVTEVPVEIVGKLVNIGE